MKNKQVITGCMMIALAAGLMLATIRQAEAQPLKVFILAGQSNMEGHANISTFDYIGDDPATAPMLKMMRGADGKPAVCDGAWISYLTGEKNFVLNGKLTAGYGSTRIPPSPVTRLARSSPSASSWTRRSTSRC